LRAYLKNQDKILIQCDFDGTVTIEDASFAILDAFIPGKWRDMFKIYQEGGMSVGEFNSRAFSMVKADKESLLKIVRKEVSVRDGFTEFVTYCKDKNYSFVIVSNGLDFYIKDILERKSIKDIEIHASITEFQPSGLGVRHKGPDGNYLDKDVKASYTDYYLKQGHRVIYLGDGTSDVMPAGKSHYVFATDSLVEHCRNKDIKCTPFSNFYEVIKVMESWE
jgi:2-hydroxy-3-keto-5-methylthiopentenyl-1-phosphate phosphatase